MRCILGSLLIVAIWVAMGVQAVPAPAPARVPVPTKEKSFIIKRVENPRYVRVGSVAVRHVFGKYGWDLPSSLVDDDKDNDRGTPVVKSLDKNNSTSGVHIAAGSHSSSAETQFLVPVTVGGQALVMNLDTGSSDLWVFSSDLPASSSQGHTVFDPAKSPTFKPIDGATFNIKYGDRSWASGTVGIDAVNIGGAEVREQALELATTVSGSFIADLNSDGLIGLGFSVSNQVKPKKQSTFFDNIMPSLEQPLFTAVLKRAEKGSYEFGAVDESKFRGPLHYVPINPDNGWWQFDSPGVVIGDRHVSTNDITSIADTGTSILLMHDDVVKAYYDQVSGAHLDTFYKGFVYPCDASLPDLGIAISDTYTATISGHLMTFNVADKDKKICFGALQSNKGQPVQILGDTLFNSQFVVFDGGRERLGFAPHV